MHAIRPMVTADIPVITSWMVRVPLWQRYRVSQATLTRQFEEALQQHDILVVADDGPPDPACGFAWVLPRGAFGISAYLRLIGVRPDQTSKGIGAALLREAERLAAERSRDMFLLVSDFNTAAQRFYQRLGYQQVGRLPGYVLANVDELILWKRLRSAGA